MSIPANSKHLGKLLLKYICAFQPLRHLRYRMLELEGPLRLCIIRTSLVVQWLRIRLPMRKTGV